MRRAFEVCGKLQPESPQVGVQRLMGRRTVTALTAAAKMPPQSHQHITIESIKHAVRMSMTKVGTPTPQGLVEPADQRRQRHPVPLRPGLLADFLPKASLGLLRGLHPQVAAVSS